tara:strand:+ start:1480 stop:1752 length:273 start_codon:yes stop_codon:yes gene_type:complete
LLLLGCASNSNSTDDNNGGGKIVPSKLQIATIIIEANTSYPNGDGNGVVKVTAIANDAITYQFVYNGIISASQQVRKPIIFKIQELKFMK